jgi:hypothetical protein
MGLFPIDNHRNQISASRLQNKARQGCRINWEALRFGRRGVAQPGSASALGAEGRWFESSLPDHSVFR